MLIWINDECARLKKMNLINVEESRMKTLILACGLAIVAWSASAQTGFVAKACNNDIAKLCAGKPHDGSVRICLEDNYERVSAACKKALDTSGGGRGKGFGKGKQS